MSLHDSLRGFKSRLHSLIGRYPSLYRLAATVHPTARQRFVRSDTAIVIDGYPRSANTFSYHAFCYAQEVDGKSPKKGEGIHIAHHLHQPAQILRGVQMGVPTLVLIRRPNDCVLSYVIRHPDWLGIEPALRKYIAFYSSIFDIKKQVVIGDFDTTTTDFGNIIRRVNDKFGTDFHVFQHTPENEQTVFRRIERVNRRLHEGDEQGIARPSLHRRKIKERRRKELAQHKALLHEAQALYHGFVG